MIEFCVTSAFALTILAALYVPFSCSCTLCCTNPATCSFVITSHIPSHASTTNCNPPCFFVANSISVLVTSGHTDTACSACALLVFFLYTKSPNALDNANTPSTLPIVTPYPALLIRCFSTSSSGLWSFDSAIVLFPSYMIVLESPTFGHITFILFSNLFTITLVHVDPLVSCVWSTTFVLNSVSVSIYAFLMISSFSKYGPSFGSNFSMFFSKFLFKNFGHSSPLCPSYTPKNAISSSVVFPFGFPCFSISSFTLSGSSLLC
mmetsp:Transcript_2662/g.3834  ORF Transcript_2662/g.3834 Transcript_2662/m.3834 type:complete len:263 (+) Transcript_2662:268-1056(+)